MERLGCEAYNKSTVLPLWSFETQSIYGETEVLPDKFVANGSSEKQTPLI